MITVIGSINIDLVTTSNRLPKLGETIYGKDFKLFPGGKGANQAIASSKLGSKVNMIGSWGNDEFKNILKSNFKKNNLNYDGVKTYNSASTGTASINVVKGDNNIIITKGANHKISWEDIENQFEIINKSKIIILQNEIPFDIVKKIIIYFSSKNIKVFYNPAPAIEFDIKLIDKLDYLIVNEHEFKTIFKHSEYDKTCEEYSDKLIITLGKYGSKIFTNNKIFTTIVPDVKAIDTTGAGDTFIGSFAHFINEDKNIEESLQLATQAASLSTTKNGAQKGMPTLEELNKFIGET